VIASLWLYCKLCKLTLAYKAVPEFTSTIFYNFRCHNTKYNERFNDTQHKNKICDTHHSSKNVTLAITLCHLQWGSVKLKTDCFECHYGQLCR